MHKVDAEILNLSENQDIKLDRVNKFSIANNGTADVEFGFKDTFATLHTGQSTAFESGANAWFAEDVVLKVRFKSGVPTDSRECVVMLCRIVKPSNIFSDALR